MVTPKWDTADEPAAAVAPAAGSSLDAARPEEASWSAGSADQDTQPGDPVPGTPDTPDGSTTQVDDEPTVEADEPHPVALLGEILAAIRKLADSSDRYHVRAEQREAVIDHQRDEVDRLRRGERRGLLRPLLVETCRLRNDLLRQAGELPADFDAERAALLLRSYAESVEITLENSGVQMFAPEPGDQFDPRMHRRVGGQPPEDLALAGRVASVVRDGYLDVDSNSPLSPAEVVVFGNRAATAAPVNSEDQRSEP
jgi:molecular chaperone GrpE (heat shock protein)